MNYILVVDDSLVDRQLVGGLLGRSTPYSVEYASNGLEAMEVMEAKLPLALVTDLRMPEMDGMELVAAARRRFPSVPLILMTAHGSEDIAVDALTAGAADYVPKARLAADLIPAIESVLVLAAGDRFRQRVGKCLRHGQLEYELENDVLLIPAVAAHLEEAASDFGLIDPPDRVRLG